MTMLEPFFSLAYESRLGGRKLVVNPHLERLLAECEYSLDRRIGQPQPQLPVRRKPFVVVRGPDRGRGARLLRDIRLSQHYRYEPENRGITIDPTIKS